MLFVVISVKVQFFCSVSNQIKRFALGCPSADFYQCIVAYKDRCGVMSTSAAQQLGNGIVCRTIVINLRNVGTWKWMVRSNGSILVTTSGFGKFKPPRRQSKRPRVRPLWHSWLGVDVCYEP